MDTFDKQKRSEIMGSIRQKDTTPEISLRKALHKIGFRYKLNVKKLPGSPDIVLPRYKTVIFVHGCFWHRHGCKKTKTPTTRSDFWQAKFETNIKRDAKNELALKNEGWQVVIIWECELGKKMKLELLENIEKLIKENIT